MKDKNCQSEAELIGAEPEMFDVIHGVNLNNFAQPISLYWNRKLALKELNERFKLVVPSECVLLGVLFLSMLFAAPAGTSIVDVLILYSFVLLFTFATLVFAYVVQRRMLAKEVLPILEIRPEGLRISCPGLRFETIPWSEIREARVYELFPCRMFGLLPKDRFLGISPKKLSKTMAHLQSPISKFAYFINATTIPFFAIFRIPYEPISILEQWLPLSADDVADLINARLVDSNDFRSDYIPAKLEQEPESFDDVPSH